MGLSTCPACYRDPQVVVIIASLGPAPDPTNTCGICGFVMNELGERPQSKMEAVGVERETQTFPIIGRDRRTLAPAVQPSRHGDL